VTDLLRGISEAFWPSATELAVFFILIGSLLFILLAFAVGQAVVRRRRRLLQARRAYRRAVAETDLTPVEGGFLDTLARMLPHGERDKPFLTENPAIFNRAVERLRERQEVPEALVASLRMKLGLNRPDEEKPVRSTTELPEGMEVEVVQWECRKVPGRVSACRPDSLTVQVEDDDLAVAPDSPLLVTFRRRSGVYAFSSHVIDRDESTIRLGHSERVWNVQKRQFYRKPIKRRVRIRRKDSMEAAAATTLSDLGGGGASFARPNDMPLKPGDRILLELELGDGRGAETGQGRGESGAAGRRVTVTAEVVRLSARRRMVHVRFDPMPQSLQDRIIGHVLNAKG